MNDWTSANQLIGLSFDMPASPKLKVKQTRGQAAGVSGWGLAWYPPDDRACVVLKDPAAAPGDSLTRVLGDWQRFRSTVFVCHLRGTTTRFAQEDTQPFERSFAGRHHIMAHNGQLQRGFRDALPLDDPPIQEPVGHTDTEYFMCWLLHRLHEGRYRSLAAAGWERIHSWLRQINQYGTVNLLWSDGNHLIAYQDATGFRRLHWLRTAPPRHRRWFHNDAARMDLGGPRDTNRTSLIVASQPMSRRGWQAMNDGQMIVVSRGFAIWSSEALHQPGGPLPVFPEPGSDSSASESGGSPTHIVRATEPYEDAMQPAATLQGTPSNDDASAPYETKRTYRIEHRTRYDYSQPVEKSSHFFRLQPTQDMQQRVLSYDLQVAPQGQAAEFDDVFGNHVHSQRFNQPFSNLEIVSTSVVELLATANASPRSTWQRSTIPLVWMPWQREMMMPYLLPPELPESQLQELFEYAMSFVTRQDYDLVDTLIDLNQTIHRDFLYVQGVTTVETTPFEVFSTRRGVCQDFANLFICVARLLSIPARYRVGYIFTSANYENRVQSDASHAWVEIYLPWTGWRGFDPTNGSLVNLDHIRVACGRNYRDATPTAGTLFRGGGDEKLSIDVRVIRVDDAPSSNG